MSQPEFIPLNGMLETFSSEIDKAETVTGLYLPDRPSIYDLRSEYNKYVISMDPPLYSAYQIMVERRATAYFDPSYNAIFLINPDTGHIAHESSHSLVWQLTRPDLALELWEAPIDSEKYVSHKWFDEGLATWVGNEVEAQSDGLNTPLERLNFHVEKLCDRAGIIYDSNIDPNQISEIIRKIIVESETPHSLFEEQYLVGYGFVLNTLMFLQLPKNGYSIQQVIAMMIANPPRTFSEMASPIEQYAKALPDKSNGLI